MRSIGKYLPRVRIYYKLIKRYRKEKVQIWILPYLSTSCFYDVICYKWIVIKGGQIKSRREASFLTVLRLAFDILHVIM